MSFNFEAHDLETPIQDSLEGAVLHGIVVSNLAYFVAKEMELPEAWKDQEAEVLIANYEDVQISNTMKLRSYEAMVLRNC